MQIVSLFSLQRHGKNSWTLEFPRIDLRTLLLASLLGLSIHHHFVVRGVIANSINEIKLLNGQFSGWVAWHS